MASGLYYCNQPYQTCNICNIKNINNISNMYVASSKLHMKLVTLIVTGQYLELCSENLVVSEIVLGDFLLVSMIQRMEDLGIIRGVLTIYQCINLNRYLDQVCMH